MHNNKLHYRNVELTSVKCRMPWLDFDFIYYENTDERINPESEHSCEFSNQSYTCSHVYQSTSVRIC